jgi:hypothetical protein
MTEGMKRVTTVVAGLVLAGCTGSVEVEGGGRFTVADDTGTHAFTTRDLTCSTRPDVDGSLLLVVELLALDPPGSGELRLVADPYELGTRVYYPQGAGAEMPVEMYEGCFRLDWYRASDALSNLVPTPGCQLRVDAGEQMATGEFRCADLYPTGFDGSGGVSITEGHFTCAVQADAVP